MSIKEELDLIEKQHNLINNTVKKLKNKELDYNRLSSDLLLYVTEHFGFEEKLCKKYKFKYTVQMEESHLKFIKNINFLIAENTNIDDITIYLETWLSKHIVGMDQELINYMLEKEKNDSSNDKY